MPLTSEPANAAVRVLTRNNAAAEITLILAMAAI
jgi:hypothetical protein